MVYDVENLFTVRPQRRPQLSQGKDLSSENQASLFHSPKRSNASASQNDPFDLPKAFARLRDLLHNNSQAALEQNYRGKGSLLNIIA